MREWIWISRRMRRSPSSRRRTLRHTLMTHRVWEALWMASKTVEAYPLPSARWMTKSGMERRVWRPRGQRVPYTRGKVCEDPAESWLLTEDLRFPQEKGLI